MPGDRIVAVSLLTQSELDRYGGALKKVFAIEDTPRFAELLRLLDEADRQHWPEQDRREALRRLRSQGDA
ncbi:MAG TPA: hypothetical protein VIC34_15760 [Croceibacterium sp.]|jgi:hypothetical protein